MKGQKEWIKLGMKDFLLQTSQETLNALCEGDTGDPTKRFCIRDINMLMKRIRLMKLICHSEMVMDMPKTKTQRMLIQRLERMTSCETHNIADYYVHIPFTVQALLLMYRLGLPLPLDFRIYRTPGDCMERILECRKVAEYWKKKKLKRKKKKKLKRLKEVKRKKRCLQ